MKIVLWLVMIISLLAMLPMAWLGLAGSISMPACWLGLGCLTGLGWFAASVADAP